jgi:hypothetical protein
MEQSVEHRLTELEQRSKSDAHRLEKLEKDHEALHSMAASLEVMANEQKHQTQTITDVKTDVCRLESKVDVLESKPAKRWDGLVEKAIWAVVAAVIAFILGRVGL